MHFDFIDFLCKKRGFREIFDSNFLLKYCYFLGKLKIKFRQKFEAKCRTSSYLAHYLTLDCSSIRKDENKGI